jgi:hypothetical protein
VGIIVIIRGSVKMATSKLHEVGINLFSFVLTHIMML